MVGLCTVYGVMRNLLWIYHMNGFQAWSQSSDSRGFKLSIFKWAQQNQIYLLRTTHISFSNSFFQKKCMIHLPRIIYIRLYKVYFSMIIPTISKDFPYHSQHFSAPRASPQRSSAGPRDRALRRSLFWRLVPCRACAKPRNQGPQSWRSLGP